MQAIQVKDQHGNIHPRVYSYIVLSVALMLVYWLLRDSQWIGSTQLHTIMEVIATLLAFTIGTLALVRYYSFKETLYLYIGAGFIGTGFLDCYHAVVTSAFFNQLSPSPPPSLIPWSWVASRLFLSLILFVSWVSWQIEYTRKKVSCSNEVLVYSGTGILTVFSFVFFAFVSLPRAYYPELFFHRPEELVPAIFFLMALCGYLNKGKWRSDTFEHWLIFALIINLMTQAVFMPHSSELFDFQFDAAHLLKKISYIAVLIGLLISMFFTFRRINSYATELTHINDVLNKKTQALQFSEQRNSAILENAVDGILTIDAKGIVQSINPAAEMVFGYQAEEVIGQNIKMLMPNSFRQQHDQYLDNYARTGEKKIIGIGREVEGKKKNGECFPIDLAVSEVELDTGEHFFMGMVRDISEKKLAEKMKNEFLSTVSHELRTPLTSIHCSLGLITDTFAEEFPEQIMKLHTIAYANSERLIRLINDILDVQKMEMGEMIFDNKVINLLDLLQKSVQANQAYAKKLGNISIQISPNKSAVVVLADASRLMQVITNLISNAVKFSPENGVIDITLVEEHDSVRVVVTDKGPGIPEDFKSRIFSKFAQADSSDTRKVEGTGLGLSICKIIIDRLNGDLGFENLLEGGCAFFFTLPVQEKNAEISRTLELVNKLSVEDCVANPCILICEDDPDIAAFIQIMIEVEGWTADIALNAKEAKVLLSRRKYNAMTLDIILPDQDGISFIKEIRSSDENANLPIIMVSGKAKEKQVEFGSIVSVTDWVDKPIDRTRLQESIKRAISQSGTDTKPNILHVEDDPDIASLVKTMIGDSANIFHASSMEIAEKLFMQRNYVLILLDLMLPDGNGLDLLPLISAKAKQSTATSPPSIIIFSAYEMDRKVPDEIHSVLIKSRCSKEQLMQVIKSNIRGLE
ncbi:MAG: PAS domain S-box protein [Methyloprofundus sp.]|nr:PAS domain S-box protein [Methyloprofundus sp.]